jgi:mono/diheme cytochrome c family protein
MEWMLGRALDGAHMSRAQSRFAARLLTVLTLVGCLVGTKRTDSQRRNPDIPTTWEDAALADWATPVADLNVRPSHMTAKEYYALPTENVRTYPVYVPDREPRGYWEMLQRVGPTPLIEPDARWTEADWISAGQRVFDELDHFPVRTLDPRWIAAARSAVTFDGSRTTILPTGEVFGMRWVPTRKGVALSFSNCSACHVAHLEDGRTIIGAPAAAGGQHAPTPLLVAVHQANRIVNSAIPFRMGDEPFGMWLYRAFGVPWVKDDIHERLKTMTPADLPGLLAAGARGGAVPRWNGSVFYPVKVPDLIGVKDRKYLDATATHLHRGIGDLMRYAALVSTAEPTRIGQYDLLPPDAHRVEARLPDEALYALALYIYSLQPPPNPNPFDERARAGQEIFTRERCIACHTPPLYTSNKITLAQGFTPPSDVTKTLDVLSVSVGTDPNLALRTRKGTGYYKVPSLKGVWYRGHYLHDGSAASLEEMFDPDRLKDSHIRGGFRPDGATTGAIQGHQFGLRLNPVEREQLLAFLRTL